MVPQNDYLTRHLQSVPAFRALLRSVEAQKIGQLNLQHPILDLGCGDGHFAATVFRKPLDAGVDPSLTAIIEAAKRGIHRKLAVADGGALPYPDGAFASVMSNSVLEHIPEIDPTLGEVNRILKPGGLFAFTTPSDHFAEYLFFPTLLRRIALPRLARSYEIYFNRISRHYRTDSAPVWQSRLEKHGLHVRAWHSYFTASASRLFDLLHYYSAPTLLYKKLLGRWVIAPVAWNFFYLEPLMRRHVLESDCADGAYLFFLCQKD
jgi:SAM-dependent methyltransferase